MPYHHGDLRRAVLDATDEAVRENGVAALSLRDLARRAGVSHAAPAHHFGDKTGLLTAFAAEGHTLLSAELERADGDLIEAGVGYLRFALTHPAHFEVMFQDALLRDGDAELEAARARSAALLAATEVSGPTGASAAWSLVHGFATLWLTGSLPATLPPEAAADPYAAFRAAARHLKP
ncbi:TetR family transcriptional regulator [Mangrovactinospora gilvigrisea]|uniref:TetR family transcriptional regulator n=1 Tax=Mangrovactinospora gilvigrisea TaxID=1428644 RepID=A0A1J7C5I6_9ACTN|nr:TetR/AcrR family transcriptional regulator [Mangrovactinospora gilvigrisea]OIV36804.1 TetR family transcriptional regulator [Mangrovactinospora gilvigrisea]